MSATILKERAILIRLSLGLPGEARQDRSVTEDVKREKSLGADSGKWQKNLYPPTALAAIKAKMNEARGYHDTVTLPFDLGIGILPAPLIMEYREKMGEFRSQIMQLVETTFLSDPGQWITWAQKERNGTFEPGNYPGCSRDGSGVVQFDAGAFCDAMRKKFYLRSEPTPVPQSDQFADTVASLLGTDTDSVNVRVRDAAVEAQRELLRRIMAPVEHMAATLAKTKPRIYETLTGNIKEICELAPKLNLSGDAGLDALVAEVEGLTRWPSEVLKDSQATRDEARAAAEAMLKKLSGYVL